MPAEVRAEVDDLVARATRHMETSYMAYAVASELSPDDARVRNDTALILAYYLQREWALATEHFERAIVAGRAALEAGIEDEAQREDVTESVGDAHQGLGVIALTHDTDAARALPLFDTSIEIGPYPRPEVERDYHPAAEALRAGAVSPELVRAAYHWPVGDTDGLLARLRADKALRAVIASRG